MKNKDDDCDGEQGEKKKAQYMHNFKAFNLEANMDGEFPTVELVRIATKNYTMRNIVHIHKRSNNSKRFDYHCQDGCP